MASKSLIAFRVQGFPVEYDLDAISRRINDLFGLDGQESDIELRSLASDLERQGERVAIVVSPRLEAVLQTGEQWRKGFPDPTSKAQPGGRRQIMLDTHFYGFTPLAVPEGEDKYCFE